MSEDNVVNAVPFTWFHQGNTWLALVYKPKVWKVTHCNGQWLLANFFVKTMVQNLQWKNVGIKWENVELAQSAQLRSDWSLTF